jgi:CRP-like cAMP-binding protein
MRHFPEERGVTHLTHNMIIDRMHYHELFEYFPAHVRNQFFNKAVAKSFHSGELIFSKGDEGSFFGAIMSGRVRMVLASHEGKTLFTTMVDAGEVFGETAMLDGLPRTVDAVAETDTTVLILQREDFVPLLMQNPEAMMGLIKMLCNRVRMKIHTIELVALQNLPGRLARYLYRLAQEYGEEENGKVTIRAGFSQTEMGYQLATSRESVNKQLKVFVDKGFISMHGEDITLHNIDGLLQVGGI